MNTKTQNPAELFNTEDTFQVYELNGRGMMADIIKERTGAVRRATINRINAALVHYGDRVKVKYNAQ